jgi:hypothetical protein
LSTVLWANVLTGGIVRSEEEDRPALYKHADKLDSISKSLGLPSFLAACDNTDVRFNMEDLDLPDGAKSTNDVMAATGAWLSRTDALSLLQGLLTHIKAENTRFGFLQNHHQSVVDELSRVIGFLQAESGAEKFNFSVVM